MKKRIFVTGAAGFIGSFLTSELFNKGMNLVAGVHKKNISNQKIRTCKIDLMKISSLKQAFEKGDIIIHLAARTGPGHLENPWLDFRINALGTLNVLRAARDNEVEKVINLSTYEVYGETYKNPVSEKSLLNPRNPYAVSSLVGEYYARIYSEIFKLKTVNLRLFNVYGPGMYTKKRNTVIPIFTERIINKEKITIFGDKRTALDFVYIGDVTNAIMLAMEADCNGESINIGSGKATKLTDLALVISKCLKKENELVIDYKKNNNKRSHVIFADISKASTILRFRPHTSIEEGIRNYLKADAYYMNLTSSPNKNFF